MTFQFTCPQGHVLQTEEIYAGQTIQCPQCGMSFLIPQPGSSEVTPPPKESGVAAESSEPEEGFPQLGRREGRFEYLHDQDGDRAESDDGPPAFVSTGAELENQFGTPGPKQVTIPCPSGHLLTTPYDTMGDEVLCPHCGDQFILAYVDSLEFQSEQQQREDTYNRRLGRKWMTWAIVAACGVAILIVALVVAVTS